MVGPSRPPFPSAPSEPSMRRLGVSGSTNGDRPIKAQLIVALVALIILLAVPLYLWRRPSIHPNPADAGVASAMATASIAPPVASVPPPAPFQPAQAHLSRRFNSHSIVRRRRRRKAQSTTCLKLISRVRPCTCFPARAATGTDRLHAERQNVLSTRWASPTLVRCSMRTLIMRSQSWPITQPQIAGVPRQATMVWLRRWPTAFQAPVRALACLRPV